jgi:glycyl-tRNA synthetase beta chain
MAEYIAGETFPDTDLKEKAGRAAYLCKADLVTEMVGEFPDLQGIMGRVYVKVAGESEEVARAIEEHYRPTHSGGALPETQTGSVLSIADKMDTICGCFSAGLVPTGASDPYALRRQGIGIVQIMLKNSYTFSLKRLIEHGLSLYGEKAEGKVKEITDSILDFLMHRLSHMLSEQGYSRDVIQAVVSVSIDNIPDTWNRVRALENLKNRPDFEPLAIAFKRVVNIIKKEGYYDTDAAPLEVNVKLFEDDSETGLYNANREIREKVRLNLIHSDYEKALQDIASLKEPVDNFFDSVMVMTDDMKIRENRLALLKNIAELFDNIADFSKIATK